MKTRSMLDLGFKGTLLEFANCFSVISVIFDMEDMFYNMYNVQINENGRLLGKIKLEYENCVIL